MIDFHQPGAEVFIPDKIPLPAALERTTDLCIAAHHDDIEIMAAAPILAAFQRNDRWFSGVVVTDGRGAPRSGIYEDYTDDEMNAVRFKEQRKAAVVGEYAAQIMLDYPSVVVKDASNAIPVADMLQILRQTHPQRIYTHNLADKHETHVAVALRVIEAIRALPAEERPQELYGCEVWRDLDWMLDEDKVPFGLSSQENLQMALLGVFDSQISGGKRYDLASLGRRRANATYFTSHGVDQESHTSFVMDLSTLISDEELSPLDYVNSIMQRFVEDVAGRIQRLSKDKDEFTF